MLLTVYSTSITTIFTLFMLLLYFLPLSATHHRRSLHHPFFSSSSLSPAQPPSPSPLSPPSLLKHPFSDSLLSPPNTPSTSDFSGDSPFFPTYPSSPPPPPPPSTTALPTFPANISSLALPSSTSPASHSPVSSKLVIVLVLLSLLTLSLIVSLSLLLHRRRNSKSLRHFPSQKPLSPPPPPPPPKAATTHHHVSHTSSEFLYVGNALTDSRDFQTSSAIEVPSTSAEIYIKLCGDSPELRPLPPLPKKNSHVSFEQNFEEQQQTHVKPDDEEFFSPRSFSRRVFFEEDNFDNYGLNSSPARSYSDFPASDSDVSVEIQTLAARTHHFPASGKVGPPAPPPPPPPGVGPPPLVPPSGPVVFKSSGNLGEKKKSGERKEETLKPKLKALHWDKVRASSDRVMVWDQLQPGSFQ